MVVKIINEKNLGKIVKYKIVVILIFLLIAYNINADYKNWDREIKKAQYLYEQKRYDESIILFREIILSSNDPTLTRESYFWIAKAYMNIDKLSQAEANLEYYLLNYKSTGANYSEAIYQKGRLLYLQEEFQSSIQEFNLFISSYPTHKLVSNAYYWIAMDLYSISHLEDSAYYLNIILTKYPDSPKVEASRYQLKLIEYKKSVLALQNLLKWSQEQYLATLNQFKVKEKALLQAIEEYEKNKSTTLDPKLSQKYKTLEEENASLKKKIAELETNNQQLQNSITDKSLEEQFKQLQLKEQILNQKEEALRILEEELRKKEKALE